MAWEWLAPTVSGASVVTTGIVAWLGLRTNRGIASDNNESARRVANDSHENARRLAAEARRSGRLEVTYADLLEIVYEIGIWSEQVRSLFGGPEDPDRIPAAPKLDNEARTVAHVQAFASEQVRALVDEWRATMRQIQAADWRARRLERRFEEVMAREESSRVRVSDEELDRLDPAPDIALIGIELQPKEQRIRQAIARQIGIELGHHVSD